MSESDGPVSARLVAVAAAVTGGWAAVVSLAPVLVMVSLGWFGDPMVPVGTAVRFAVTGWLLAHGVPITAGHGPISLMPLALTALVVWRLTRAGAHTARAVAAGPRDLHYVVLAVGVSYGLIGGVAALAAATPSFAVSPVRAFVTTGGLAVVAGGVGAAVESKATAALWARLSEPVRAGLRGGLLSTLTMFAAGAALAGLATAMSYQDAVAIYRDYQVGVGGGVAILLVGLLYTPNLVLWAVSYLVGPGFAVGVGTQVTVFDVSLGPLPAVPVLAALPDGPAPTAVGLLLAMPVLAGMVEGISAARRHPASGWVSLLTAAAVAGSVAGGLLAVASFAASGSLGGAHLAHLGPTWWLVGSVAAGLVTSGSLLAASFARLLKIGR